MKALAFAAVEHNLSHTEVNGCDISQILLLNLIYSVADSVRMKEFVTNLMAERFQHGFFVLASVVRNLDKDIGRVIANFNVPRSARILRRYNANDECQIRQSDVFCNYLPGILNAWNCGLPIPEGDAWEWFKNGVPCVVAYGSF